MSGFNFGGGDACGGLSFGGGGSSDGFNFGETNMPATGGLFGSSNTMGAGEIESVVATGAGDRGSSAPLCLVFSFSGFHLQC